MFCLDIAGAKNTIRFGKSIVCWGLRVVVGVSVRRILHADDTHADKHKIKI